MSADRAPTLTPEEQQRYARQIGPGVLTLEQQARLKGAAALVTRCGGMGGPAALALAMAGVGRLILAHGGELITPDLNRQILGSEAGLGRPRAAQFGDTVASMNRFAQVTALDHEPDDDEVRALAREVDVILSCPPTFEERLRLNDAAVDARVPLVDAAQWGMMGTLTVVHPGRSACLRCIYPQRPEFEELFPVIGAISGAIGNLAALEAIKLITGVGRSLVGATVVVDAYGGRWREMTLARDPDCPCCGGS